MGSTVSDLLKVVREAIGLYRDLIEHSRFKTSILVQGKLEEILESNRVEDTFNLKLCVLENEMARICSQLCQTLQLPRGELTLANLADRVEPSIAVEIRSQTGVFSDLVEQLNGINACNMKLLENSLHYSKGLLDFISNATSAYQGSGLFKSYPAMHSTICHQA